MVKQIKKGTNERGHTDVRTTIIYGIAAILVDHRIPARFAACIPAFCAGRTNPYLPPRQRRDPADLIVNVLGRKWEFTFTTLVTFGGAFFASFPLFYSTSFGGAYWVWMIILFAFVIQAVSYEFRSKPGNFLGKRTFETFLFINGLLGTILLGAAVSTFFTGSQFSVDENNFSRWETATHGLEAAFNVQNLSLGLAVFFLARTLAVLYFIQNIDHPEIIQRARRQLLFDAIPFVVFFLLFTAMLLLKDGFAVDPQTGIVSMEKYKYLHNFLQMPVVAGIFLTGVILVLLGILRTVVSF
ncbi:MAG: cytochrome d ubiquinol oxidase subunit II [Marinilabiliales bacterium]|nr:cytochrome d ubiquinol oxidase subunit II [Marinilabiliales bacterium]